jgi:diguanylate cyclase (GGDEF)-like protein/PAS domain S-box-containing protein
MTQKKNANYKKFRSQLLLAFALLMGLTFSGLGWKVVADYHAAEKSAMDQTSNLVQAVEAHVNDSIESIDASVKYAVAAIQNLDEKSQLSHAAVASALSAPTHSDQAGFWMLFIDAKGMGVASSNGLPVEGVNYSQRAYFKSQLDPAKASVYIGEPVLGKVSKLRNFYISRRVESAKGEFLGVAVACVDSAKLAKFLKAAQFVPSLSLTVTSLGGKIIARSPLHVESFGLDISKSQLLDKEVKKAPQGSYQSISVVDGDDRLYSYRVLEKMPIVVVVGMISQNGWHIVKKDLWEILLTSLGALLVSSVGCLIALKSFRELGASELQQRRLNEELTIANSRAQAGERRERMLADNIPAMVAYIDSDMRYRFRNSYYKNVKGIDYDNMIGKTVLEIFGEEIANLTTQKMKEALKGKEVAFDRDILSLTGRQKCFKYQFSPDIMDDGTVAGFYALITDVSEMREVQTQLRDLARIDSLTKLPNRAFLHERIVEALARNKRHNRERGDEAKIGCLYMDIDHFKTINDTLGHAAGDAVLREFGERLKKCVRQTDMVARIAGDEFVIVLEGLDQPRGAASVASKIIAAMAVPFTSDRGPLSVSASIGVAIAMDEEDVDALLRRADHELYKAKNSGRATFSIQDVARSKNAEPDAT